MELTINQALQKAFEAHQAGKLLDAERLYIAILQAQTKNPVANHNLGVLAISSNKMPAALHLLKTALEADPNQGQFWLSYIDALIQDKQFDNARSILKQGREKGLEGVKVDELEDQLSAITLNFTSEVFANETSPLVESTNKFSDLKEKKNKSSIDSKNLIQLKTPSQIELNNLLDQYKKGRYELAQKLAITLTEHYPNHPFGWKILGVLLKRIGKIQDSLIVNKKLLEISPNDAEAHSNMGVIFRELGRLNEAEQSYKKAIAIKPDYAEAYNNFGNTLKELGRLKEAEQCYRKAIATLPTYAEAHSNLGVTLNELGRILEAEKSYKKAIAINPNYSTAYNNLGNAQKELGKLQEAEQSYKKAIAIKPDYAEAYNNFGNTLKELGRLKEAEQCYKKAIAIMPNLAETYNNLGNTLKDLGRLQEAEQNYKKSIAIKPDYAEAYYNLGFILKEFGRIVEAEVSYGQAVKIEPDFIKARNEMLICLFSMDKKSSLFAQLDFFANQDKTNSVVGSLTCRSGLRYGEYRPNTFCNEPLNHVLLVDLKSRYDFEEIFVRNVKSILGVDKKSSRRQPLLFNGYQTSGNLFDVENSFTAQIQKTIRLEIERYRINFESSADVFIKKWPVDYRLYGWLISMSSGGELSPHIHENGWLSGSIYINVPPKTNIDSGNLIVALGKDSDVIDERLNSKRIIDVVTGSMALFPASLMHHTIPFESEEERIVLAFDVIPKS